MILLACLAAIIVFVCWIYYPRSDRSFVLVLTTAGAIGGVIGLCIIISRAIPITRTEHVNKIIHKKYVEPPKVVYKDKIVYRTPGQEVAPVDVKAICSGKFPVTITQINVSDADKDSRTSWVTGHMPGSIVKVTCGQPGDYSDSWKTGDTVQFIRGIPQ